MLPTAKWRWKRCNRPAGTAATTAVPAGRDLSLAAGDPAALRWRTCFGLLVLRAIRHERLTIFTVRARAGMLVESALAAHS